MVGVRINQMQCDLPDVLTVVKIGVFNHCRLSCAEMRAKVQEHIRGSLFPVPSHDFMSAMWIAPRMYKEALSTVLDRKKHHQFCRL